MSGTIIKTKFSLTTAQPISNALAQGEQAYSFISDKLWLGWENGGAIDPIAVGGKFYTDQLKDSAVDFGKTIASHAITTDSSNKIDLINIDNITIDGNTISTTDTNGNLIINPNGTGDLNIQSDTNIVGDVTMSNALVVANSVAIDSVLIDNNIISATNTNGSLTITPTGTGVVTIDTTTGLIVPSGLEASRPAAAAVGDGTIRYNETSNRFEGVVSSSWTGLGGVVDIDQDTYITAEEVSDDDTLRMYAAGVQEAYVDSTGLYVTDQVTAPIGNIGVMNVTTENVATLNVSGDAVVDGNLTVNGTTTAVNSTVTTLNDPVIKLGDGSSSALDLIDRGVNFDYGDGTAVQTGFFGFDNATNRFVYKTIAAAADETDQDYDAPWGDAQFYNLFLNGGAEIDGNVNITTDLTVTGDVSFANDVPVLSGGTGMSSFTGNGVFISNGTGDALTFITGALYDVVQFNAAGVPVASNVIDGGTF